MRPEHVQAHAWHRPDRRPLGPAKILPVLVVLLVSQSPPLARPSLSAESTPQQRVEGRLMCYCGCSDLTVRLCTCGTAEGIREEIAGRLANGETPDQVVAAFVARHGEQIRSAPTKSGFDLVAWVTPFLALILAGSALVVVVRRWGAVRPAAPTRPGPPESGDGRPPTALEQSALERVRREMKEDR